MLRFQPRILNHIENISSSNSSIIVDIAASPLPTPADSPSLTSLFALALGLHAPHMTMHVTCFAGHSHIP
jgi:hypothetical protein